MIDAQTETNLQEILRRESRSLLSYAAEAYRAIRGQREELRILSRPLGVAKIDASSDTIVLQFRPNPPIDPARIIALIQSRKDVKLSGQDRLRFTFNTPDLAQRVQRIREILKALAD